MTSSRCSLVLYSGKLSREKTFANFAALWLFVKVFSAKFGGVVSFGMAQVSDLQKFSLQKSYFSQKFSPSNVSRYIVAWRLITRFVFEVLSCMGCHS